jgi:hypothetical protein
MCRLLKVTGLSLTPDYQDGDFVLISKIPILFKRLCARDVVAFRRPEYGTMIKRVERIEQGGEQVFVVGSHPSSVDSRQFGPVPCAALLGKVILHIRNPLKPEETL